MVESQQQRESAKWWWFGRVSDSNQKRSPWLQSTLSELDEMTREMLKLIEQDADSFAQRAEMYYKKRPELISMVQEFYITHRSLAERFDLFRSESGIRLMTPWASPLSVTKCPPQGKSVSSISMDNRTCDTYSETYATEEEEEEVEYEESDVEDPEPEKQILLYNQTEINQVVPSGDGSNQAMTKLMEKIERLQEENRAQKEQLVQKDEEKRDVIRQLSLAMDLLREENRELMKSVVVKDSPQKHKHTQLNGLDMFWRRLFSRSSPPPEIKS